MESKKFDPEHLAKLNDPRMIEFLKPDFVWEKLELKDPEVLVDIGAGTGFFALLFGKKMKNGKIYACDISDVMLDWMRENLLPEPGYTVIPLKMNESSVPLPDDSADLVYMIDLHHELEEPVELIVECCRLLKKGGKLMIIDWKKEETPKGPPVSMRIPVETIYHQMDGACLCNIRTYDILPYHNFIVGQKKLD
jgi:ubiquinone/menaquinone biosynthesis C-methylase UbiE